METIKRSNTKAMLILIFLGIGLGFIVGTPFFVKKEPTQREYFVSQCALNNTKTMNLYCGCAYDSLVLRFGDEGITTVSASLKTNGQISMDVFKTIQPCVALIK